MCQITSVRNLGELKRVPFHPRGLQSTLGSLHRLDFRPIPSSEITCSTLKSICVIEVAANTCWVCTKHWLNLKCFWLKKYDYLVLIILNLLLTPPPKKPWIPMSSLLLPCWMLLSMLANLILCCFLFTCNTICLILFFTYLDSIHSCFQLECYLLDTF